MENAKKKNTWETRSNVDFVSNGTVNSYFEKKTVSVNGRSVFFEN